MSTFYFAEKLGNAYSIGLGENELGKIWFGVEGESQSPLSQTEAELMATKIVAYLNENHPVTEQMAEEYGDSEEPLEKVRTMNKMAEGFSADGDDEEDEDDRMATLLKLMLLKSVMGD